MEKIENRLFKKLKYVCYRVFTRCVFCLSYEQILDRILQNHRFGPAFSQIPIFLVVQQNWKTSYFLLDRNIYLW